MDAGPLTPESTATLQTLLTTLMEQKFAEPFLEPVDWKAWGLFDYPEVIKNPMDLGTIEGKLKRGEYTTFEAFRKDMQLVIDNCMTYNDRKADVYKQAVKLQKAFDKEVAKLRAGGAGLPEKGQSSQGSGQYTVVRSKAPTIEEKDKFCKLVFQLKALDLGRVIEMIDELCPAAIERTGTDEIDINVDVIDAASYRKLEAFARDLVGASKEKESGPASAGPISKRKRAKLEDGEGAGGEEEEDADA